MEVFLQHIREEVDELKREVARLEENMDDTVTDDDLQALREAKEEHRQGKTVRID